MAILLLSVMLGSNSMGVLEWDVPWPCPSAAEFEQAIAAYLGQDVARRRAIGERQVEVQVHVDPSVGPEMRLELKLRSSPGAEVRHELWGASCHELSFRAAALTATFLDPYALLGELPGAPPDSIRIVQPEFVEGASYPVEVIEPIAVERLTPASTPTLTPSSTPSTSAAVPPDAPSSSPPSRPVTGFASASASLALALFENPNPGVHAQLGIACGLLRVSAHGGSELAGRFGRTVDSELSGTLRAWELGLRSCVAPEWGRAQLRGCVAAGAGQLRAGGVGFEGAEVRRSAWVWVAPELGAAWSFGSRVALFVDLGLGVSLLRPRFDLGEPDNPVYLYTTPIIAGRGRLGIELRFE